MRPESPTLGSPQQARESHLVLLVLVLLVLVLLVLVLLVLVPFEWPLIRSQWLDDLWQQDLLSQNLSPHLQAVDDCLSHRFGRRPAVRPFPFPFPCLLSSGHLTLAHQPQP